MSELVSKTYFLSVMASSMILSFDEAESWSYSVY